jgi:hypothetical protein
MIDNNSNILCKNTRWYQCLLSGILIILLTACTSAKPPLEFAPDPKLIQKAIALQLSQTENRLSKQLNAINPEVEINQIRVKIIEPVFVEALPSYRLQGTYNLKLKLPRQEAKQTNNPFEIYLQRQIEGKTWRLLRQQINPAGEAQWSSYLIE